MAARLPAQTPFEQDLLEKLTERWGRRVSVKQDELDLDGHFDPALPDFPDRLVPVFRLPAAAGLDAQARHRILAAAWVSYNEKTIAIENEVILPACRLMLREHIPAPGARRRCPRCVRRSWTRTTTS